MHRQVGAPAAAIGADGRLQGYDVVGYIVVATTLLAAFIARKVAAGVASRAQASAREPA